MSIACTDVKEYLKVAPPEIKRIIHALDGEYRIGILIYLMDHKSTEKELSEKFNIGDGVLEENLKELSKGALLRSYVTEDVTSDPVYETSEVGIKTVDKLFEIIQL